MRVGDCSRLYPQEEKRTVFQNFWYRKLLDSFTPNFQKYSCHPIAKPRSLTLYGPNSFFRRFSGHNLS